MSILIYSANPDSDEQRLLDRLFVTRMDICRSLEQVRYCLNMPSRMRKIVVLVINNLLEMSRVAHILEMYLDLLIIVILEPELFEKNNMVHQLRPKYITYKDGDFRDVAAVLRRLQNRLT